MQGSEVDTDGLSAHVIFKLAVDIAKKRQSYKPRTPVSELHEKNERSVYSAENKARYMRTKAAARKIYNELLSADKVKDTPPKATPAKVTPKPHTPAAAAAAAGAAGAAGVGPSASDVEKVFATSDDDADAKGDDEVMQNLEAYNKKMQQERIVALIALYKCTSYLNFCLSGVRSMMKGTTCVICIRTQYILHIVPVR